MPATLDDRRQGQRRNGEGQRQADGEEGEKGEKGLMEKCNKAVN